MRTGFLALLFAVATVCFADTKAEIAAAYDKFNDGLRKKDLKVVLSMIADDFTWSDAKGNKTDRAGIERQLKVQFAAIKKLVAIKLTIERVTVSGSSVVAHTKGSFEADVQFDPSAKKLKRLKSLSTTDDTWVKSGGKWIISKVRSIEETTTLDGKPFGG